MIRFVANPCLNAFSAARARPETDFGPVLFRALARFAAIRRALEGIGLSLAPFESISMMMMAGSWQLSQLRSVRLFARKQADIKVAFGPAVSAAESGGFVGNKGDKGSK
jgi:hypothetical protein